MTFAIVLAESSLSKRFGSSIVKEGKGKNSSVQKVIGIFITSVEQAKR